jgi:hypothetical protein
MFSFQIAATHPGMPHSRPGRPRQVFTGPGMPRQAQTWPGRPQQAQVGLSIGPGIDRYAELNLRQAINSIIHYSEAMIKNFIKNSRMKTYDSHHLNIQY